MSRPTGGRLVYTVPEGDGMARVWRWNLATDEVSRGPLVRAPVALVNVRSAGYGWLGVTSDDEERRATGFAPRLPRSGRRGRAGRQRRHRDLDPTRGHGAVGRARAVARRLPPRRGRDRGRRRAARGETVLRETICGDVLSVGRTSVGYFLTVLGRGDVNVVGIGYEDAGILLRAPRGDRRLARGSDAGDAGDRVPARAALCRRSRMRRRSAVRARRRDTGCSEGCPSICLPDAAPLRIERVLAYTDGGTRALVIGRQGLRWRRALGGAARDRREPSRRSLDTSSRSADPPPRPTRTTGRRSS